MELIIGSKSLRAEEDRHLLRSGEAERRAHGVLRQGELPSLPRSAKAVVDAMPAFFRGT